MALQLSSIKTSFGYLKKDISDVSDALFVEWMNNIMAFVYKKVAGASPDKMLSTYTISVNSGTTSYALPADFGDMDTIGTGLYPVDSNGDIGEYPLAYTGYASVNNGYYISDTNIVLTPKPTASTTYVLRYLPATPVFTSTADYFTVDKLSTGKPVVDTEEREYLIRALDVQYSIWDEDLGIEGVADQRFVRILSDMLSRARSTPGSYNLTDYSFNY